MLRNLKTSDIFKVSKILKEMNLKIDLSSLKLKNESNKNKTQEEIGKEMVLVLTKTIFENLHLAEESVTEFFADLSSMTKEEFSNLEIEKTFEIINEFKNIKGISNFFKQANQLTK